MRVVRFGNRATLVTLYGFDPLKRTAIEESFACELGYTDHFVCLFLHAAYYYCGWEVHCEIDITQSSFRSQYIVCFISI